MKHATLVARLNPKTKLAVVHPYLSDLGTFNYGDKTGKTQLVRVHEMPDDRWYQMLDDLGDLVEVSRAPAELGERGDMPVGSKRKDPPPVEKGNTKLYTPGKKGGKKSKKGGKKKDKPPTGPNPYADAKNWPAKVKAAPAAATIPAGSDGDDDFYTCSECSTPEKPRQHNPESKIGGDHAKFAK